ncbi:protein S40-5-like [Silene latifolia]|uniref:protein S40-5-like n=1 Tax=Silene latifolia TaxID=37657 RepID=UPI003D76D1B5
MAKGRRLTNSRSERLLGTTSFNNYGHVGHVPYNGDVSEFAEEDIWSMVEHVPDHNQHNNNGSGDYDYVDAWTPRAATETGRRDRVSNQSKAVHVGGLSLAFEDETTSSRRIVHQFGTGANNNNGGNGGAHRGGRHVVASSAPVNVPDWSKILRVDSAESMFDSYEDDQVDDSGMEPPHEYLARSRKMDTFSVYEGVGRTLKGRDMSRVRDAVWSQTGFEG